MNVQVAKKDKKKWRGCYDVAGTGYVSLPALQSLPDQMSFFLSSAMRGLFEDLPLPLVFGSSGKLRDMWPCLPQQITSS